MSNRVINFSYIEGSRTTTNGSGLINLSDLHGTTVMSGCKGIIIKSKTSGICVSNAVKWSNGYWYVSVYDQLTFALKASTLVEIDSLIFY